MHERNQQAPLDLTRKLNLLRERYSEDYFLPEQLIYSREKTKDLPEDYISLMTCFCNVYKMRLTEREKLPETARKQFEESSRNFQTPIVMAQKQFLAMYAVDFLKPATEWQSPEPQ